MTGVNIHLKDNIWKIIPKLFILPLLIRKTGNCYKHFTHLISHKAPDFFSDTVKDALRGHPKSETKTGCLKQVTS